MNSFQLRGDHHDQQVLSWERLGMLRIDEAQVYNLSLKTLGVSVRGAFETIKISALWRVDVNMV